MVRRSWPKPRPPFSTCWPPPDLARAPPCVRLDACIATSCRRRCCAGAARSWPMLRNLASSTWSLQWNDLVRCRSTTLADALRPGGAERRRFERAARPERREQPTDGQQAPAAGNPHHIDNGSGNFDRRVWARRDRWERAFEMTRGLHCPASAPPGNLRRSARLANAASAHTRVYMHIHIHMHMHMHMHMNMHMQGFRSNV